MTSINTKLEIEHSSRNTGVSEADVVSSASALKYLKSSCSLRPESPNYSCDGETNDKQEDIACNSQSSNAGSYQMRCFKLPTVAIEESIQTNRVVVNSFVFKKKAPRPGMYPTMYSPFRMVSSAKHNAVSLSEKEISKDIRIMQSLIATSFQSVYFEEKDVDSIDQTITPEGCLIQKASAKMIQNAFINKRCPSKRTHRHAEHTHVHKSRFEGVSIPVSEREERRQMKAAIRASLASVRKVDVPDQG
mmetsp:Transcript_77049/g.208051  ORF Transcript_77049/g.208051 Transcript_77049/m.208051 type:complete len:247 (+) Transcript_77049:48-788(+)|eukprot:CAMPEP_0113698774 /NCGR_PEP_ID=MMETSP0038_2-20120614/22906_1 /TAXON_ID=2898 /ORGANISM="Cryptomonas paramecium" /LENGTH=246 /DNA_ID=CAMNT_0000621993 /DNA_START=45 /DNA_END=785 /DNA_ORIENTATION=+ /assembly_acc=CAM_ASM_000170